MSGPVSRPTRTLTEEQRALAANYVSLALMIADRVSEAFPWNREDNRDVALIALCEAAREFRDADPIHFHHFARRRVRWELMKHWKKAALPCRRPDREVVSLQRCDLAARESLIDWRADPAHRDFDEATEGLSDPERQMLRDAYIGQESHREAADRLGISESAYGTRFLRVIKKLRAIHGVTSPRRGRSP